MIVCSGQKGNELFFIPFAQSISLIIRFILLSSFFQLSFFTSPILPFFLFLASNLKCTLKFSLTAFQLVVSFISLCTSPLLLFTTSSESLCLLQGFLDVLVHPLSVLSITLPLPPYHHSFLIHFLLGPLWTLFPLKCDAKMPEIIK